MPRQKSPWFQGSCEEEQHDGEKTKGTSFGKKKGTFKSRPISLNRNERAPQKTKSEKQKRNQLVRHCIRKCNHTRKKRNIHEPHGGAAKIENNSL